MARNRFEQVDERQEDAITLSLWKQGDDMIGSVTVPAGLSRGRLANDSDSGGLAAKDAFRAAVSIANEIKAPMVVMDPEGLWQSEWGDLYRYSDD
jgi:hypothetical protein